MTRGKRLVSPVGPLPSSAAGRPAAVAISSAGTRDSAAPAMSVAATETPHAGEAVG